MTTWNDAKEKAIPVLVSTVVSLGVYSISQTNKQIEKNTAAVAKLAEAVAAKEVLDKGQDYRLDQQRDAIKELRDKQVLVLGDVQVLKSQQRRY